jgi:hypothetical protein
MDQLQREALLVYLAERLRDAGSWCGETQLQKTAYFLQDLTGVPLGYDFMLYKHGPFEFELRGEIRELIGYEMLAVETQPPPYGPRLRPTKAGNNFISTYREAIEEHSTAVEFVVEVLGNSGAARLEKLGTALWYTVRGNRETREQKAQKIHDRKPHITVEDAMEAIAEVEQLLDRWQTAA